MSKDLKKLKRLETLLAIYKEDNSKYAAVMRIILAENLWKLVADSIPKFLELEFGIPEGRSVFISNGKLAPL